MARLDKTFKIQSDKIRPLATKHGACIASDMITVEGKKVGFMYREAADFDVDSGWRFMSGYESQDFMDDADNHAVYDVNTIANYDPGIIPFLKSPIGSAFERVGGTGPFIEVEFELPED
jgi:hypothetical protein